MSAVSNSVMPASSAASITASDSSKSQRPPKLFVPRPTTETCGPPPPSVRMRMTPTLPEGVGKRSRMDDDERLRRSGKCHVQLPQSCVASLLDDQRRLDDDDVVELEALRLPRRQHGDGHLIEGLPRL